MTDLPNLMLDKVSRFTVGGNFHQENFLPITPPALVGEIFIHEWLHIIRGYGDLYRIAENLFDWIFLQYKRTWAWRKFYLANISAVQ